MYQFFRCSVIKIVLPPRLDSNKLFGFCFYLSNFYPWELILISCHVSAPLFSIGLGFFWKWVAIVISFGSYVYISHEVCPTPVKNFMLLSCAYCGHFFVVACFCFCFVGDFCLFLFVIKMWLKAFLSLYILFAVWFIFSNTAVICDLSQEPRGHMCFWVLGQKNTFSSNPFPCVGSLFTAPPWSYLALDPSLTRLSSCGVKAAVIALSLLPSRNAASLHPRHEGSLLF